MKLDDLLTKVITALDEWEQCKADNGLDEPVIAYGNRLLEQFREGLTTKG
jgi:hypothetical protein